MAISAYHIEDVRTGHILKHHTNGVYVVTAVWYPGPKQYDLFDTQKLTLREVTSTELRSGLEEGKFIRLVPEIERKVKIDWRQ